MTYTEILQRLQTIRRNIPERVAKVAPFLTFDQDPYMVVGDDGRLS
jgi:uncharacterized membrane protein (UPF0182 family)